MKHTSILIALLAVFVFVGCGGQKSKKSNDSSATTSEQTTVKETKCGGFSPYRKLTDDERNMFIKLTCTQKPQPRPLKVATQVVAGTKYRFKCILGNDREHKIAIIDIFKPLPADGGEPKIINMVTLEPHGFRKKAKTLKEEGESPQSEQK